MSNVGFMTQRERILKAYQDAGKRCIARTLPYHSTGVVEFDVVDADETAGIALAVARKNQSTVFFSYGVGEQCDLGGTGFTRATEAETNLGQGEKTDGAQDFVIEGVGFSARGLRIQYTGADLAQWTAIFSDDDVQSALAGDVAVYDPAAVFVPAQFQSPFNLENGTFQAQLGLSSLEFVFDRKRIEKVGTMEMFPQAGAASYLRANGSPEAQNRYKIPEGYLWRRAGEPDSQLQVTMKLARPIVVPISLCALPSGGDEGDFTTPSKIWLECTLRLYGLAVDLPSEN